MAYENITYDVDSCMLGNTSTRHSSRLSTVSRDDSCYSSIRSLQNFSSRAPSYHEEHSFHLGDHEQNFITPPSKNVERESSNFADLDLFKTKPKFEESINAEHDLERSDSFNSVFSTGVYKSRASLSSCENESRMSVITPVADEINICRIIDSSEKQKKTFIEKEVVLYINVLFRIFQYFIARRCFAVSWAFNYCGLL